MKAPQAAGVIHTDFEKFIRAGGYRYNDYVQYGSEAACKEASKLRVAKDTGTGRDVMHFRFNVDGHTR